MKMKIKKIAAISIAAMLCLCQIPTFGETQTLDQLMPSIVGEMALTIDMQTGEIIYAKNIDALAYPASTTKIMTALIFAENAEKSDLLTYTQTALDQPSYSLNKDYGPITIASQFSGQVAMEALLVYSANDIAYMIAEHVGGSTDGFMSKVNERIKALGLTQTHFTTANGKHDEKHYTTPYELSVLTRESFKNPWVKEVLSLDDVVIPLERGLLPVKSSRYKLLNSGPVLSKTGYTPEAGRCLVSIFERDGKQMVGIVMRSIWDNDDITVFNDMNTIMDWSFDTAQRSVYLESEHFTAETSLTYNPISFLGAQETINVPLVIKEDVDYYANSVNQNEIKTEIQLEEMNAFELDPDVSVGKLIVTQREATLELPLYPTITGKSIKDSHKLLYIAVGTGGVLGLILTIGVTALIIRFISKINGRGKRQYSRY